MTPDTCPECDLPILEDGSGCTCVISDLECTGCGMHAPEALIHSAAEDDSSMAAWVREHSTHGVVAIHLSKLQ